MVGLIINAINVFLLFMLLGYILSPMAEKMLSKRKESIAAALAESSAAVEDTAAELAMYQQKLADFEQERTAILDAAKAKAAETKAQLMKEADAEAKRIAERAQREAGLMEVRLEDDMKKDMITAAAGTAAKLIAEQMDPQTQDRLITQTLDEMGASTWQS